MNQARHNSGFTLLELLTVIAIMVILMGIAGASYYGMSLGAAMTGSSRQLRTSLLLARQYAVNHRSKTHVYMWQDATNSYYQVFVEDGRHTGAASTVLKVDGPRWAEGALLDGQIYNLSNMTSDGFKSGTVIENAFETNAVRSTLQARDSGGNLLQWGQRDICGWAVQARGVLRPGIKYGTAAGVPEEDWGEPETFSFDADGTRRSEVWPVEIPLHEINGPGEATLLVAPLTGRVSES